MKLLILVQSCLGYPFNAMMKAQRETWDSTRVPGVSSAYYVGHGGRYGDKIIIDDDWLIQAPCPDNCDNRHWKMKFALDAVWHWDWDLMFRTNASSYVDKTLALAMAYTLPLDRCYCGMSGGDFASGCGVFLSRDCVDVIRRNLDASPVQAEDALMGSILARNGFRITPGADRMDYWWEADDNGHVNIRDTYHYRCKPRDERDRDMDVKAFKAIHEFKMRKANRK